MRGEIAGPLDDRTCGRAHGHAELVGDDVGQGGLAEAGRPVEQHVIEGLAALPRRGDGDVQVLADLVLADVLVERARTQSTLVLDVVVDAARGDQAFVGHVRTSSAHAGRP